VPDLSGFFAPRSPEGRASVIPAPPWHYSGDVLTLEYRAAPGAVASWLPIGIEPADDEPDAVAVVFADWQSSSDGGGELLDPVRSQYKECFVVVRCRYRRGDVLPVRPDLGRQGLRARARVVPGVPEEARVHLDDPSGHGGTSRPPARVGWLVRSDARGERPTADRLPLHDRARSDTGGFVNALPMLHSRWMPSIDATGSDVLNEIVTLRSRDVDLGPAFTGSFELTLHDAPGEELASLAPVEPIAGYWRQVGATFTGGEHLA
jgi:Acetoacetate decarboxylase (ADC).